MSFEVTGLEEPRNAMGKKAQPPYRVLANVRGNIDVPVTAQFIARLARPQLHEFRRTRTEVHANRQEILTANTKRHIAFR
jgi:hypothetical protein